MAEFRRLYLGNLPRDATKQDVEDHFGAHRAAIAEVKLMQGFGFLEFNDPSVAAEVVDSMRNSTLMGERLVVQPARGSDRTRERRDNDYPPQRAGPRPRRTVHRMTMTGLPDGASWQDLKDFARQPGLDVVFSEIERNRGDPSAGGSGFVEYETAADLESAVDKLDGQDFKGAVVRCVADTQSEVPRQDPMPPRGGGGYRARSRSPDRRGGGGYRGGHDDYDRRGPPRRGYSPPRDDYRRRSPPPRDYYESRRGGDSDYPPRSPHGRGGPSYDRPPRGGPDSYGPPPRRDYDAGPPAGREPPYGRGASPPPRRDRPYDGGYERRYW